MKLLMLSTDQNIFQAGSAVRARMVEYAKNLEALHIIVFTNQKFLAQQFCANGWVYATNSWSKWLTILDATNLGKNIITDHQISEITCQDPFLTGMVALKLKQKFQIPLEIQVHTDIGSPYFTYNLSNRIRKFLAQRYLPQADKIRVVSGKIKSFLIAKLNIPEEKITVRAIGVDAERIKSALVTVDLHVKYSQFEKIILIASRLTLEKDLATALRAFKLVQAQNQNAGLVIVGAGPELVNLRKLVAELDLGKHVVFETWLSQDKLFSYYKTADVFLSTSLYEGYGLSMMEANAAGLKVVATDAGIASELTKQVCPVGDAECLAGELLEALA